MLLSNSVFAPVPLGRGPDSFRLYEALEMGAIPVITDIEAFNVPLGDHPIPMWVAPHHHPHRRHTMLVLTGSRDIATA